MSNQAFEKFRERITDLDSGLTHVKLFRIWHILSGRLGRDQAIVADRLCELTNLNEGALRDGVKILRRHGFDVCSGNVGYYRSESPEDILNTAKQLESRAASLIETARLMREQIADVAIQDRFI